MGILANDLKKYRSFNYRWSFGPLAPSELNNPSTYRSSGGNLPILRSGGLPNKPVTTAIEDSLGLNLEFFIDDVVIDSLVSINPGTGPTSALTFEFKVIEPYSVGLFFQSLYIGAKQAGYSNYIQAPFILSLDFVGWDDNNTIQNVTTKRCYVIQLVNVTFKVDSGGTIYNVSAIPYNHVGFTDQIQSIKRNLTIKGATVDEMLNSSENSLANELNRIDYSMVGYGTGQVDPRLASAAGILPKANADRYKITFPSSYGNFTSPSFSQPTNSVTVSTPVSASNSINSSVNEIGNSQIVENINDMSQNDMGNEQQVWDGVVYTRGGMAINPSERKFTFREGTKIQQIIESVILASEWGKRLSETTQQPDSRGMINWFRIDTKVNIISLEDEAKIGRPSFEIEYVVIPYKIHVSRVSATNTPQNYAPNIADCKKAYYYSYTGKNSDIIDFDFTIDNGFFNSFFNTEAGQDAYSENIVRSDDPTVLVSANPVNDFIPYNIYKTTQHNTKNISPNGGPGATVRKDLIARVFNDMVLNSHVDNISLNLKILGDPYFLSDNDAGNYRSSFGSQYINADGTADFLRSELDVLIQFNSGIDYSQNYGLMILDPVMGFNGIYRVTSVLSTFSKGQFTQELRLLRRPNQTEQSISISNTVVSSIVSLTNLEVAVGLLDQSIQSVTQIVQPFLNILPSELQNFSIDNLRMQIFESLESTAIFQAIDSVSDFINSFQQIRSNLLSTIQGLAQPFDQIRGAFDNIQASIDQIKNGGLPGIATGLQSLASNIQSLPGQLQQIQSNIVAIPTVIEQSLDQLQQDFKGTLQTIQTEFNNFRG
jgi:hypothetical protein